MGGHGTASNGACASHGELELHPSIRPSAHLSTSTGTRWGASPPTLQCTGWRCELQTASGSGDPGFFVPSGWPSVVPVPCRSHHPIPCHPSPAGLGFTVSLAHLAHLTHTLRIALSRPLRPRPASLHSRTTLTPAASTVTRAGLLELPRPFHRPYRRPPWVRLEPCRHDELPQVQVPLPLPLLSRPLPRLSPLP